MSVCDHQVKPPSKQLYVENRRAHEVILGCQQSVQGNSGIIIGASIWLAIAADHFGKWLAIWQVCTENGQCQLAVIFRSREDWSVWETPLAIWIFSCMVTGSHAVATDSLS